MNSLIIKASTWHSNLSPIQKVGVAGVAITTALIGARGLNITYHKLFEEKDDYDDNYDDYDDDEDNTSGKVNKINKKDPKNSSYLYRLKKLNFHPVFWGSYLLNSMTWAFTLKPYLFNKLPRIYTFSKTSTLLHLLPPVPKTMSQAFML